MYQKSSTLIHRLQPKENESLESFLSRLGAKNYYPELNWINPLVGVPKGKSPNFLEVAKILESIAILTKLPVHQIESMTLHFYAKNLQSECDEKSNKKKLLSRNQMIKFISGNQLRAKICPICVKEDSVRRLPWRVRQITTCNLHKILLVDFCTNCRSSLALKDNSCVTCGIEVERFKIFYCDSRSQLLSDFTYWALGLQTGSEDSGFRKGFPEIRPCLAINFIWTLANLVLDYAAFHHGFEGLDLGTISETGSRGRLRDATNNQIHIVLSFVCNLLLDWPLNWFEFLSEVSEFENLDRFQRRKAGKKRQTFIHKLFRSIGYANFEWFWDPTIDYIFTQSDVSETMSIWLTQARIISIKKNDDMQDHLSVYEVMRELNHGLDTIIKLVELNILEPIIRNSIEDPYQWIFSKRQIRKYEINYSNTKDVAELLGVSHFTVRYWCQRGWLPFIIGPCNAEIGFYIFDTQKVIRWRNERMVSNEVREFLNISQRTLEKWVHLGKIEPIRNFSKRPYWFWREDIENLIAGV